MRDKGDNEGFADMMETLGSFIESRDGTNEGKRARLHCKQLDRSFIRLSVCRKYYFYDFGGSCDLVDEVPPEKTDREPYTNSYEETR